MHRVLSWIIAFGFTVGVLMLGLSTSVTIAAVQRLYHLHMENLINRD